MAFEISAQPRENRVLVTLTGFASLDEVERFERDLRAALMMMPEPDGHQLLYDVSAATIQSQEVVYALRRLALRSPKVSAMALVNASALAGRQLNRIFAGMDVHLAKDRAAATTWLDDLRRG